MHLSSFKNPKLLVLIIITVSLTVFSCKKEEEDIAKDVVYTYLGAFNTPNFNSISYKVTVTKVDNTTVKIAPEDTHGDSFEVSIASGTNGAVNGDAYQVVFVNDGNGNMGLSYKKGDQQFSGVKQ